MRKVTPLTERIKARIAIAASGCWEWQGTIDKRGYGRITIGNGPSPRRLLVHRVAYEAFRCPIPAGLHIDHLCRNTRCCNPAHLEPVTPEENRRRAINAAVVKGFCRRGHAMSGKNILPNGPNGKRTCRICANKRKLARYYALRAEGISQ
jgi:hypothetical protein